MCVLGLLGIGYGLGRCGAEPQVQGAPQGKSAEPAGAPAPPESSDYSRRWVAVIHGNIPITRQDFGEYLIARQGEKLELLVNKCIIEQACQKRGITVTNAEVDAALNEDLKGMNMTINQFVTGVLKNYHKSLYEWREDVIRPRLALAKMCRDRVTVTDQDLKAAFEAYYGEKVDCRIILFDKKQRPVVEKMYDELRKSEERFDQEARHQASPSLAAKGGQIQPIGHLTTGNPDLEKEAFSLRPGEVSRLIETPEGVVVMKCIKRIEPDAGKKLETERAALEKEVIEKKTQLEMPKLFKELQDEAQPKLFIKKYMTQEDLERDVKRDLEGVLPADARPGGNP
jgi:hypothetical protein